MRRDMVVLYSISCVDGLSTRPLGFGCHKRLDEHQNAGGVNKINHIYIYH